jgi:thiol-disulfide isomerase/thioredoxin
LQYLQFFLEAYYIDKISILGIKICPIDLDTIITKEIINLVTPLGFEWEAYKCTSGSIFASSLLVFKSPKNDFFESFIKNYPNNSFKADEIYQAAMYFSEVESDREMYNYYSKIYITLFPNTYYSKEFTKKFDKKNPLALGNKIPNFKLVNLKNPDEYIRRNDLRGKYTLIDIWATWCGPCIKKLPLIKKIYETYSSDSLQILSISFDKDNDICKKYQDSKFSMPWLNAIDTKGFGGDLASDFNVYSIPTIILIDPDLKIVAVGDDLQGDFIWTTMDKYVKKK